MISFHHSFSTRIFLNEKSSPERDARRAQAAAALERAQEEARTPNELREFWWFLRSGQTESRKEAVRSGAPRKITEARRA